MERLTGKETYCSLVECDFEVKYGIERRYSGCRFETTCFDKKMHDKLKEYEDLEEQGLLLKLPCKVGNTVWCIDSFELDGTLRNPPIIREIKFNHHHLEFVNKTVFLTKEEAEKALEEMEKKNE